MKRTPYFSNKKESFFIADFIFIILIFAYAYASWQGILRMSEHGATLDTDLQTYAQGMAGEAHPDLFQNDPVLQDRNAANSIPNLQRMLAGLLLKDEDYAGALLGAGAVAIFVFYAGWYLFGRVLFRYPVLSALLSLLMGVTIWLGWGTFWGINHSDPVPRTFFAALFPFLLLLGIYGGRIPSLRPLAMLACGLAMWAHGVNALNCGAMFFCAFLFLKNPRTSLPKHFWNLFLCLVAFFVPVLYFLWPSLAQGKSFSAEELALFQEFFAVRWFKDYSVFSARLLNFFSLSNPPFIIILSGIACWIMIYKKSRGSLAELCRMFPGFIIAITLVTLFCWLEGQFAPQLGRLPMGHELIRGIRLFIPLSWIMAVGLLALYMPKFVWRFLLFILVVGLFLFTSDRQYVAAQYYLSQYTGISLHLFPRGEMERAKALENKKLVELIKNRVPQNETVFSDEDLMQTRYLAMRPLAYAFKDGYVHYYNKDYPKSAQWLKIEKIIKSSPNGYVDAWLESGAPWFVSRKENVDKALAPYARFVEQSGPWRLYQRK